MRVVKVYLAGSIQKGEDDKSATYDWRERIKEKIRKNFPDIDWRFLDPDVRKDDISDQSGMFGRDILCVISSDFLLIRASEKAGLGVGVEMTTAKHNNIPVIFIAPKGSYYNRAGKFELHDQIVDGWIHPFVKQLSDMIVDNEDDAMGAIRAVLDKKIKPKGKEIFDQSVSHYKDTHYEKDEPMKHNLR